MTAKPPPRRLDREAGSADAREALAAHLPSAPVPYLEGALENPRFGEDQALLLLRNRAATPALLSRIARNRTWVRRYRVKRALTMHPRTPHAVARTMLGHLRWTDVLTVLRDVEVPPPVRRDAEKRVLDRIGEMTLGEKIAIAHRATPPILEALADADESLLLRALLGNERLPESVAAAIAARTGIAGTVLEWISVHPVWGGRFEVQRAVATNPSSPVAAALRSMRRLPDEDLAILADLETVPKIVRVGARRRLARAASRKDR